MFAFFLTGVLGGFGGALFVMLNIRCTSWRRESVKKGRVWFLPEAWICTSLKCQAIVIYCALLYLMLFVLHAVVSRVVQFKSGMLGVRQTAGHSERPGMSHSCFDDFLAELSVLPPAAGIEHRSRSCLVRDLSQCSATSLSALRPRR